MDNIFNRMEIKSKQLTYKRQSQSPVYSYSVLPYKLLFKGIAFLFILNN